MASSSQIKKSIDCTDFRERERAQEIEYAKGWTEKCLNLKEESLDQNAFRTLALANSILDAPENVKHEFKYGGCHMFKCKPYSGHISRYNEYHCGKWLPRS